MIGINKIRDCIFTIYGVVFEFLKEEKIKKKRHLLEMEKNQSGSIEFHLFRKFPHPNV